MRTAIRSVASELAARANPDTSPVPVVLVERMVPRTKSRHASTVRGAGIALIAFGAAGLIAGVALGTATFIAGFGHIFCSLDSSCDDSTVTALGIGAGISAGVGLAMLLSGIFVVASTPSRSSVSVQLGPTGGSLRVTF